MTAGGAVRPPVLVPERRQSRMSEATCSGRPRLPPVPRIASKTRSDRDSSRRMCARGEELTAAG